MSNAERVRQYRERVAAGYICLTVEVDKLAVCKMLVAAGLLDRIARNRNER